MSEPSASESQANKNLAEEDVATLANSIHNIDDSDSTAQKFEEEGPSWHITYLDTVTILLTLMVLILAMQGQSESQREAVSQALRNTALPIIERQELSPIGIASFGEVDLSPNLPVQELQQFLELNQFEDMVELSSSGRQVSLQIKEALLFASGEADLSPKGEGFLSALAPTLSSTTGEIAAEGFTDNVPISTFRYPSNWELSSARATAVVRQLIAAGVKPDRLRAVGYAQTRPIATNETAEGRATNRRVTISLKYEE